MSASTLSLPPPPGPTRTRLRPGQVFGIVAGALAGLLVVAVVAVKIGTPPEPPPCPPTVCPRPAPQGPTSLLEGIDWTSPLGFSIQYPPNAAYPHWVVTSSGQDQLQLHSTILANDLTIWVAGVPATGSTPIQLIEQRVKQLQDSIPTLAPACVRIAGTGLADQCPDQERAIQAPAIGPARGIGGLWSGATGDSGAQMSVAIMAATDGHVSIVVSVATTVPFDGVFSGKWPWVMHEADRVLDSLTLSSTAGS